MAKTATKVITVQRDPLVQIFTEHGSLVCGFHKNKAWCKHLDHFITDNSDGEHGIVYDLDSVTVPMFPTYGLFAVVHLDPVEKAGGKKMLLEHGTTNEFIGFLMPGEGRGVIRRALIAWVTPQFTTEFTHCKSRLHGAREEADLQGHLYNQKTVTAVTWSLVRHRLCLACQSRATAFDPGDIPEL